MFPNKVYHLHGCPLMPFILFLLLGTTVLLTLTAYNWTTVPPIDLRSLQSINQSINHVVLEWSK